MPGRTRSGQSRNAFGLPRRTRNTIVLVDGTALPGSRVAQSLASSPRAASASMSYASARVTTSAASPSITARVWAPEPPLDVRTVIASPVLARHVAAKMRSSSRYSSRVGS